jgi:hypothetical protein
MPSRFASALMPMSTSSSENACSSRIAVVTDDSRSRLRGSVLPVGLLAMARPSTVGPWDDLAMRDAGIPARDALNSCVPQCGPLFQI